MTAYNALRQLPPQAAYRAGDVLVLCGELFGRGYANGIIDEARAHGMTIIGATMGRRDSDGTLRPLNDAELAEAEANLGGKIINIPLEAGFDMEPAADGRTPLDLLKGMKADEWDKVSLDWSALEASRQRGVARFRGAMAAVAAEVERLVPADANLLFVHTMAGGIPRARIFMPILNRVFKGQGDRYLSSEAFWQTDLGKLCQVSFDEVTADTFLYLMEATASLRERICTFGGRVRYMAYGYHGCEVLINGVYTWQSYTPYLQGWAKIRLEEHAAAASAKGIGATVFNCPEILTNSSALFLGVEISLYPLLAALEREGDGPVAAGIGESCGKLLREGVGVADLLAAVNDYLGSSVMARFVDYAAWPEHNTPEQAELMLNCSAALLAMNANPKEIVCAELSRAVFSAVGRLMFDASWEAAAPVYWLNHDVIAKRLIA